MDARSPVDPWHLLAPARMLQGWFGIYDFDLHHGRVVHDYLADADLWEGAAPVGAGATDGRG
jgi:hypothetical protein